MPMLHDLDLPEIDMFDPEFARDPHGTFRKARETGAFFARYQFGYFALDYETMKFIMRGDDFCRTPNHDITMMWDAYDTPFAKFNDNMLVSLSGDEHKRVRSLIAPAFTPREANKNRELMREVFIEKIAPVIPKGECEFVEAVTLYPITVICKMIGVPTEDIPLFRDWVDGLDAGFGQDVDVLPQLNDALGHMFEYTDALIEKRKAMDNPPDDMLQTLLELTEDGVSLTKLELQNLLIIVLGGGFDTTRNQLVLLMKLMCEHPHYWPRVLEEPDFTKKLIEECLRFYNPIGGGNHRVTNEDVEFRGITIPANTFITLSQANPGRDPAVNDDPETFDPDRETKTHITFGQGMHMCIGMFLARALLEEAIPILAGAMREPKIAGEIEYRFPLGVWGLNKLPITFTPGTLEGEAA